MGRSRRKFTEEESRILVDNSYTYRVTDTTIRFTLAFKEEFLKRYKEGLSPKQIVKDLGYSVDILGVRRWTQADLARKTGSVSSKRTPPPPQANI